MKLCLSAEFGRGVGRDEKRSDCGTAPSFEGACRLERCVVRVGLRTKIGLTPQHMGCQAAASGENVTLPDVPTHDDKYPDIASDTALCRYSMTRNASGRAFTFLTTTITTTPVSRCMGLQP